MKLYLGLLFGKLQIIQQLLILDLIKIITEKNFLIYYEKRITELINEHNVQLIDLSSIKGENKKLFCDYAHKTLEGNKLVAKTIYEFLEENSKFFH